MFVFLDVHTRKVQENPWCEHQSCPYRPQLDIADRDGMLWLVTTLKKIVTKGPTHKSFDKAVGAANMFHALIAWVEDAHKKLHERDAKIEKLEQKVHDLEAWVASLNAIVNDSKEGD